MKNSDNDAFNEWWQYVMAQLMADPQYAAIEPIFNEFLSNPNAEAYFLERFSKNRCAAKSYGRRLGQALLRAKEVELMMAGQHEGFNTWFKALAQQLTANNSLMVLLKHNGIQITENDLLDMKVKSLGADHFSGFEFMMLQDCFDLGQRKQVIRECLPYFLVQSYVTNQKMADVIPQFVKFCWPVMKKPRMPATTKSVVVTTFLCLAPIVIIPLLNYWLFVDCGWRTFEFKMLILINSVMMPLMLHFDFGDWLEDQTNGFVSHAAGGLILTALWSFALGPLIIPIYFVVVFFNILPFKVNRLPIN